MIFECVADVTKHIESIPPAELTVRVIGQWSTGEDVRIEGKRKCKTMMGEFYAVRWKSEIPGKFGNLFRSGLAYYDYGIGDRFPRLPITK